MLNAFSVTVLAGLSTGLGGLVVLLSRRPGARMMAFSLGFAAGVMLTVSLSDMLPHTVKIYAVALPPVRAALAAGSLCALGMAAALLLGRLVPEPRPQAAVTQRNANALRSAMITTLALVMHNLPEGVLTLFTGVADPGIGTPLALAIALHNIPEGIAVAVPVYYATGSRARGFFYALASGLAEPLGALLAFCLFARLLSPLFLNGLIAGIAGIMLFVSVSELLPESFSYGKRMHAIAGACIGMLVMHVGIYLV
ncbi:MAG: ZIP family metal transporter [Ruthenibacterium sp.]